MSNSALALAVADAFGESAPSANCLAVPSAVPIASRRRLWEISPKHHCALLGAAFDARELRQLFRRAGFADWQTASDYELHSSAVCFAKNRDEFSVLVHRALEKRFAAAVSWFAAARSVSDLLDLWRAVAAEGEAVAAYWAALTHPELDAQAEELLLREMHMSAHAEFAARRAALRRVRVLEDRAAELAADQAALRERIEVLQRTNRELRAALQLAQGEAAQVRVDLERWRSGEIASAMQASRAELERALKAARAERDDAHRSLREATRRLERLVASRRVTERPVKSSSIAVIMAAPACELPSVPDLEGRRLLCIGGKRAVVTQYRTIVERARGKFIYHDGGIEDSMGRLPPLLGAADAVVCLAGDCSHAAYRLAKRYCKAKEKPCALIGNSSVTALARCLGERFAPTRASC